MATIEDIIYNTCIGDGLPRPLALCVLAQSQHETGGYTSGVFLDCNNAFGYKMVRSACPGHESYQNYATVADSVHELTGWIYRRLNEGNFPDLTTITTPEQYAQLLQVNGYYEDSLSNYTNGLLSWYNANFSPAAAAGGGFLLISFLLYLYFVKKKRFKKVTA